MDVLRLALVTLGSVAALFLLTKLMGHKQVYQMTMFDYVVGITIGSVAAEMATELESPWQPLLAMTLYAVSAWGISVVTSKSRAARRQLSGVPVVLLDKGVLYRENFCKAKLDLDDFLCACRVEGYFDLAGIRTALLEHNGRISILPTAAERPLTAQDMDLQPRETDVPHALIMDGEIQWDALTRMGVDEVWLKKELRRHKIAEAAEVFLAIAGSDKQLQIYPMT